MNIENSNSDNPSSFQRISAILIDVWIVIFIRFFFMALIGELWINDEILLFKQEYNLKFSSDNPDAPPNQEQIDFVKNHAIFSKTIIFYTIIVIVGAVYYAYFHSSKWQATIGKRIMKIYLIKKNNLPISFKRGLFYYFLSILPYLYIIYLMTFIANYKISLFSAITANFTNIFLTILFVSWVQSSVFLRNKSTLYDLICNTLIKKGVIKHKFPW